MSKNDDFFYKQSEELFALRKASTENIGSASNAFLTFLGLILTAIALFLKDDNPMEINNGQLFILILIGIAVFCYGCFIHHHIWASYINQIFYTRKLNMNRAYLTKNRPIIKKGQILLPTSSEEPGFDVRSVLNEKFSRTDVVCWIKWTNTIIMSFIIFGGITLLSRIFICTCFMGEMRYLISIFSFFYAFMGGFMTLLIHEDYDRKTIEKAKYVWNNEVKKYEVQ